MSRFKWLRKSMKIPTPHNKTLVRKQQSNELSDEQIGAQAETGSDIGSRIAYLRCRFSESSDVVYHTLITLSGLSCALIYITGMIDQLTVEQSVLKAG